MYLMELLLNKQCCLIASSQGKNYSQINAFLTSSSEVKRNFKIL